MSPKRQAILAANLQREIAQQRRERLWRRQAAMRHANRVRRSAMRYMTLAHLCASVGLHLNLPSTLDPNFRWRRTA
jgi:hypothetical protein